MQKIFSAAISKNVLPALLQGGMAGLLLLLLVALPAFRSQPGRVLVFTQPGGSEAIRLAHLDLLRRVADNRSFRLDTTSRTALFSEDSLKQFRAVIFLHTLPERLDNRQQADLERYVQAGGGMMAL